MTIGLPGQVLALCLGVTPGALKFETGPVRAETQSLEVFNQADATSTFQAYVDDEYSDWVAVEPEEFVLGPAESHTVDVTISPRLSTSEDHDFVVYVVSFAQGSNLRIGAGVKIPVHVDHNAWLPDVPPYVAVIVALAAGIIITLAYAYRTGRTTPASSAANE